MDVQEPQETRRKKPASGRLIDVEWARVVRPGLRRVGLGDIENEEDDEDEDGDLDSMLDEDELLYVKGERRGMFPRQMDGQLQALGAKLMATTTGAGSSTAAAAERVHARVHTALHSSQAGGGKQSRIYGDEGSFSCFHSVLNLIRSSEDKAAAPRCRGLTQDTRATVDQVLDPRTLLLLEKLFKWNVFSNLFGCISTGKEANVYLGACRRPLPDGTFDNSKAPQMYRAIKVFKTSILVFKDRARYVEGEFRFRRGYAGSSNPRKMVRQWAEKEYRNLRRLNAGGLRCPAPIELRGHVLAMSFLGNADGVASPKLKQLLHVKPALPLSFWRRLYVEAIVTLRLLFQKSKLVHGDFSEYNLLFHLGHCYVIDVSQSVEQDHVHALDFLKRDCMNTHRFFSKVLRSTDTEENEQDDERRGSEESDSVSDEEEDGEDEKDAHKERIASAKDSLDYYVTEGLRCCGQSLEQSFCILSARALFDYVTKPELPWDIKPGPIAWPEFDAEFRQQEEELLSRGVVIPSEEFKKRPNGEASGDTAVAVTPSGPPAQRTQRTAAKPVHLSEFQAQWEVFKVLCCQTLEGLASGHSRAHLKDNSSISATQLSKVEQETADNVFLNSWIPSHLNQVSSFKDLEDELDRHEKGEPLLYGDFLAHNNNKKVDEHADGELRQKPAASAAALRGLEEAHADDGSDDEGSESDSSEREAASEGADGSSQPVFTGQIPKGMDPKEWKKLVKEEKREKRKSKIPKHLKKKYKKKATANRKK